MSDDDGGRDRPHVHLALAFCPQCGHELDPSDVEGGRPRCPRCGYVRYEDPKLATGVVVEHRGRIVLVRRNHEPAYGGWSFPSGYVDAGEVVERSAEREVREETGLAVELVRLLGVYSSKGERVVFIAYAGRSDGTREPVAGSEAIEVGLFDPDVLPELAFEHDPAIVEAWRATRGSA